MFTRNICDTLHGSANQRRTNPLPPLKFMKCNFFSKLLFYNSVYIALFIDKFRAPLLISRVVIISLVTSIYSSGLNWKSILCVVRDLSYRKWTDRGRAPVEAIVIFWRGVSRVSPLSPPIFFILAFGYGGASPTSKTINSFISCRSLECVGTEKITRKKNSSPFSVVGTEVRVFSREPAFRNRCHGGSVVVCSEANSPVRSSDTV